MSTPNPFEAPERGIPRALTILEKIETSDGLDRIAVMSAHANAIAAVEHARTEQARLLLDVLTAASYVHGAPSLRLTDEEFDEIQKRVRGLLGFLPDRFS